MLSGKSILITGGTGSFGKSFTKTIVEQYPDISRLVIYSRDEQKQFQMSHEYPHDKYPFIRFFIGDIRDHERLKRALKGIDYVVHAAAMKHMPVWKQKSKKLLHYPLIRPQHQLIYTVQQSLFLINFLSPQTALKDGTPYAFLL